MKRITNKMMAFVLVSAMLLTGVACSSKSATKQSAEKTTQTSEEKKQLTSQEFISAMQAEGFSIDQNYAEKEDFDRGVKEMVIAFDAEDPTVELEYILYENSDLAKKAFDANKSDYEAAAKALNLEDVETSVEGNKMVLQDKESYTIAIIEDNLIITAWYEKKGEDKQKKAESALKSIGLSF